MRKEFSIAASEVITASLISMNAGEKRFIETWVNNRLKYFNNVVIL
jgi:hypothetical protein